MEKITLKNGVDLYVNKSDKFKTWSASVYMYRPLNTKEASYNALLAAVLRSSTKQYPGRKLLARRLDALYSTIVSAGVRKYNDTHALVFVSKSVCDCFLPEKISDNSAELLVQMITEPDISEGAFKKDIVETEKNNLIKQIEAYINDKASYADKKCLELMFKDDIYSTDVNGSVEELKKITPESLYEHYLNVMKDSKADVFLSGNVNAEEIGCYFEKLNSFGKIRPAKPFEGYDGVREQQENMEVTQGKLVMGFKTAFTTNEYRCPMMVFNGLFGGTATSKLFNNVREKLSLAYYANTRLNLSKGVIFARSGIEISKYNQVREEILKQLDEIKQGNVTDEEMENTISHLVNVYSSLADDPQSEVSLKSGWNIEGETRNVEQIIEGIKRVTKEEVIECAKSLNLSAVYFLKGEEKA